MSALRAAYGPSLPELLGARRWRIVRAVAIAAAIVIVAVVLIGKGGSDKTVVERGTPSFNYTYAAPLTRFGAAGVRERRGALFVQSMDVLALRLPSYAGDAAGTLPVMADALAGELAKAHPGFATVGEGRARINDSPGYYLAWEARLGSRKLFGRDYMLVPGDQQAPRIGVRIQLISTYAGGVASADDVGRAGKLKQALRSFRFGTERP